MGFYFCGKFVALIIISNIKNINLLKSFFFLKFLKIWNFNHSNNIRLYISKNESMVRSRFWRSISVFMRISTTQRAQICFLPFSQQSWDFGLQALFLIFSQKNWYTQKKKFRATNLAKCIVIVQEFSILHRWRFWYSYFLFSVLCPSRAQCSSRLFWEVFSL